MKEIEEEGNPRNLRNQLFVFVGNVLKCKMKLECEKNAESVVIIVLHSTIITKKWYAAAAAEEDENIGIKRKK